MIDHVLGRIWRGTAGVTALCADATSLWNLEVALGILAGGAWNLASLWCLTHLLAAWLGPDPSRRRAVAWLLLKFPLLYVLAFAILRAKAISFAGFCVGFTIVLVAVIGRVALHARRLAAPLDGR